MVKHKDKIVVHARRIKNGAARSARKTHYHVAHRPHTYLSQRFPKYHAWHQHRHHKKVHVSLAAGYSVLVFLVVLGALQPAFALNVWTQDDWSGGQGSNSSNQFTNANNTGVDQNGDVALAQTDNSLSNGSLDSDDDLNGWLGVKPTDVSGLQFYAAADTGLYTDSGTTPATDGHDVQQWNDQSGNAHHAAASSSSRRPTLQDDQINGRPALVFGPDVDTANNSDTLYASLSSMGTFSQFSIFTVGSFDYASQAANNYDYIYSIYNSSSPTTLNGSLARYASSNLYYSIFGTSPHFGPTLTSGFKLFSQKQTASVPRHFLWLDRASGSVDALSSPYSIANPTLALGKYQNSTWALNGRIAEFAVYNRDISTAEQHSVENYLNNKYNLGTSRLTIDTDTKRSGAGSAKVVAGTNTAELLQEVNLGNTQQYRFSAYAYTNGQAVTSGDAQLYYDNAAVETTYTDVGDGWYRLSATVTGAASDKYFGVQVKADKTVYIDDINLSQYQASGTLTSAIFDTAQLSAWNTISLSVEGETATVKVRSSNSATMDGAPDWSTCEALASNSAVDNGNCVTDGHRYVQYQLVLSTDDPINTPIVSQVELSFTAFDDVPPTGNASDISMLKSAGGDSVASNDWTNGPAPYFSWTAGEDAEEKTAGIKGYCLYLGQDENASPVTSKGILGASPVDTDGVCQFAVSGTNVNLATSGYLGTALSSSSSPYYLSVLVLDNGNNVYEGDPEQFQFRFDNTPPTNPSFISAPSQFVSSKQVNLTWPHEGNDGPSDSNSGVAGLQYRIGNDGTWYGDAHSGDQDNTDLLVNDGSYTTDEEHDYDSLHEGNNLIAFRTYDEAGNYSTAHVTTVIKLNTSSPGSPQNVTANPTTNTTNSFAFSWLPPASFTGAAANLTYCYTVNATPNANNCSFTDPGTTSLAAGAFATQPGENTFYVVAKDEAGNINYDTAASTKFTANTPAPGIPVSAEIADVSNKSTASWKLALSWNPPEDVGAGVSSYKIYRSTNNTSFSEVAATAGTSYVDTGLDQTTYYYKMKACDSANNCGAFSSTVNRLPTGRFTEPASLVTAPSVQVSTRTAKIVWATDRTSDSRIQLGTASGQYDGTEAANSEQTKNHTITLNNLTAGTTYYYKAKWTDEDGNIGTSGELSFTTLPAPTISDVQIRRVTLSGATMQFVAKDAVRVKVFYGLSNGFGGLQEINTSTVQSTYTVELAGLSDGSKYFYKINTIDADGNEYDSGRIDSFTTPARPRIINLRFQPVEGEPTSTQSVTWQTNVPATSLVRYSTSGEPNKESGSSQLTTDHKVIIRGLKDDSNYTLVAESRDQDGNLVISDNQSFKTALDTRPPKVSNLRVETTIRGVGSDARGQLIVSWQTDEPTTSQVSFGPGSSGDQYPSSTAEDANLTTEHTVVISDLATSQVYHLKAVSRDKSKNIGTSDNRSAIIGQASDSVIDLILGTLERIFNL